MVGKGRQEVTSSIIVPSGYRYRSSWYVTCLLTLRWMLASRSSTNMHHLVLLVDVLYNVLNREGANKKGGVGIWKLHEHLGGNNVYE